MGKPSPDAPPKPEPMGGRKGGSRVRRGRINPVVATAHKNCVLPKARKKHQELVEFLKAAMPKLANAECMCRIARFIHDVGKSGSAPKTWWQDCITPRFQSMAEGWQGERESRGQQIDARIKEYLDFLDEEVWMDLADYHRSDERVRITATLVNEALHTPSSASRRWFDEKLYPVLFPKAEGKLAKVVTFGNFKTLIWDTYDKIISAAAPMLVYKVEKGGEAALKRCLDILRRAPRTPAGKPVDFVLGQVKVPLADLVLNKDMLRSVTWYGPDSPSLRVSHFEVKDHVYSIPVLSGLLSSLALVLTLADMAKEPSLKQLVNSTAGVCAIGEAVSQVMITRVLRAIPEEQLPVAVVPGSATGVAVRGWTPAAKIFGTMAAIGGFAVSVWDTRDFLVAADYNAAAFAGVGAIGGLMMLVPAFAPVGILFTLAGAIGAACCADDEMEEWGKTSPFGRAWDKKSPQECEKALKTMLHKLRQKQADEFEKEAKWRMEDNETRKKQIGQKMSPLKARINAEHIAYNTKKAQSLRLQAALLRLE